MMLSMTGCRNSQTPTEKMYRELEKVVTIEKNFEKQQDPLVRLEKQEQELYNQIISLGMKNPEEIRNLADKALDSVAQRKEHIEKEEKSMEASENEFKKIEKIIDQLKNKKEKKAAQNLYQMMMKRYDVHDELYQTYLEGIKYDSELYELLKKEDVPLNVLEAQINKINETYEKVMYANKKFNEYTSKYNEMKLSFYQVSGLDVNVNKEDKKNE